MKALNKYIILRLTNIFIYPTPNVSAPNLGLKAPELATTPEPVELPLLLAEGLVLVGVTLTALVEALDFVVEVTGDPADALNTPVIETHSVAR